MLIGRKAQEVKPVNKLVVIIIAILVLVAVLVGIFFYDIPDKFKNIFPDFRGLDNQEIYFETCPVKIAEYDSKGIIFFCGVEYNKQGLCPSDKIINTGLTLDLDKFNVKINRRVQDIVLGQLTRGVIILDRQIREREGDLFDKFVILFEAFINFDEQRVDAGLSNLNGAYIFNDKKSICRDELLKEEIQKGFEKINRGLIYNKKIFLEKESSIYRGLYWGTILLINQKFFKYEDYYSGIILRDNVLYAESVVFSSRWYEVPLALFGSGGVKIGERKDNQIIILEKYRVSANIKGFSKNYIIPELHNAKIIRGKIYKQIKQEGS
jgi:hypothetical protein